MKFRRLRVYWGDHGEHTEFSNVYLITSANYITIQKDCDFVGVFYCPKACVEVG